MRKRSKTPEAEKKIRCAIYTRKSVAEGLEQEFNSLDAQREAAEAYIRSQSGEGWVLLPDVYSDGGFSGGNMERPGVKRLLQAVERGEVDCIVVYKVDRLSRSLIDFARIMEVLERHNCSFVSVTQQFNTSHSMGRLTLNILLSFAQFEREIIAERTRDKIVAARKKGKWTGGYPILGYNIAKDKRILVNREEARMVREIYDLYLQHHSTLPIVKELQKRGWRTKTWESKTGKRMGGQPFTKQRVYAILTNPLYMGKVRVGDMLFDGEHEAIIDEATFERVRDIMEHNCNNGGVQVRNRHGALLKGLLFDAQSGYALSHTFSKKGNKLYRYYVNLQANKEGKPAPSLPAAEIEAFVVGRVEAIGSDAKLQQSVFDESVRDYDERSQKLESERKRVFGEIERITNEIHDAASQDDAVRLAQLREKSSAAEERLNHLIAERKRLDALRMTEGEVREAMASFSPCWEQMVTRERTRLLELLIEKVLVDSENGKIAIKFRPCGIHALLKGAAA